MKSALSINDAAREAAQSRTSLYRSIRAGNLIARKAGRKTIVLREDLEAYLKALPVIDHAREDARK